MPVPNKDSVEELRRRFDSDVDRFSDEQTGQVSAVDAALVLEMVERSVERLHPTATALCDIGCGAGNFSLRIARKLPALHCTLVDLSRPMLERARERLEAEHFVVDAVFHCDIREAALPENAFDIVVAGASLHHLRTPEEWLQVFSRVYRSLKEGGTFWIWDLIRHENPVLQAVQDERFSKYLVSVQGEAFRDEVFRNIADSDTPETLPFLLETLTRAGFEQTDILHKNTVFAALFAQKRMKTSGN